MNEHIIANLNGQIIKDPVLMMAMQRIFEWANMQGLLGIKTVNLKFKDVENRIEVSCWTEISKKDSQ